MEIDLVDVGPGVAQGCACLFRCFAWLGVGVLDDEKVVYGGVALLPVVLNDMGVMLDL